MATPTIRERVVLARHGDTCECCLRAIVKGESLIAKVDSYHGWVHESCAEFLASYEESTPEQGQQDREDAHGDSTA